MNTQQRLARELVAQARSDGLSLVGPVEVDGPQDRDGTLTPVIVKKRQRRLNGVDKIVLSLTARGLTTGEIAAHLGEV